MKRVHFTEAKLKIRLLGTPVEAYVQTWINARPFYVENFITIAFIVLSILDKKHIVLKRNPVCFKISKEQDDTI